MVFSLGKMSKNSFPLIAIKFDEWYKILESENYNVFLMRHKDYTIHTSLLFTSEKDSYQLLFNTMGLCLRKAYIDKSWIQSNKCKFITMISRDKLIANILNNQQLKMIRMRIYTTCTVVMKNILPLLK